MPAAAILRAWTTGAGYRLTAVNPLGNTTWGVANVSLARAVNPGETTTLQIPVTAPAAVGTHNFAWQMMRDGIGIFGAPIARRIAIAAVQRDARFVSQTVPTTMGAGQMYPVVLRFSNQGWQTWRAVDGVRAGAVAPKDTRKWSATRGFLSRDVAAGEIAEFRFNVRAPTTPGRYDFSWQMLQERVAWFGAASPVVSVRVQ